MKKSALFIGGTGTISTAIVKRLVNALDYVLAHPDECQKEDPEFDAWCDKVIEVLEQAKEQF